MTRFDDIQARLQAYDFPGYPHAKADVRWLLDRVTRLETALTLLVEKAEQYFDTGRGDLDGAVDFARSELEHE